MPGQTLSWVQNMFENLPVLDADAWVAIYVTLKLAGLTTVLLLVIATPIAWWLARTRSGWRGPASSRRRF